MIRQEEQERIRRIHRSFLRDPSTISIERAKYYTEKWRETEAGDLPTEVRVALSVKHVYENMGICIHPDDFMKKQPPVLPSLWETVGGSRKEAGYNATRGYGHAQALQCGDGG